MWVKRADSSIKMTVGYQKPIDFHIKPRKKCDRFFFGRRFCHLHLIGLNGRNVGYFYDLKLNSKFDSLLLRTLALKCGFCLFGRSCLFVCNHNAHLRRRFFIDIVKYAIDGYFCPRRLFVCRVSIVLSYLWLFSMMFFRDSSIFHFIIFYYHHRLFWSWFLFVQRTLCVWLFSFFLVLIFFMFYFLFVPILIADCVDNVFCAFNTFASLCFCLYTIFFSSLSSFFVCLISVDCFHHDDALDVVRDSVHRNW